jgi:multiple sugar transport system substrate-binding protein
MNITRRGAVAAAATLALPAIPRAQGATTLNVHYSMPAIFKPAQDAIAEAFMRQNPAIRIDYGNPTPTYEDGAQLILRGAATRNLPDMSFQGLNRLRIFAERGLARDLRPFLTTLGDPAQQGYSGRSSPSVSRAACRPGCPSRCRIRSATTTWTCSSAPGWTRMRSRRTGTA